MNRPDIRQLLQFCAVARFLHFGKAATALGVSQPPLSRSIKRLEEILGTPLFHRTKRKVCLTPEGRAFFEGASRVVDTLDQTIRDLSHHGRPENRRLRIGFVPLADGGVFPTLLKEFKARNSGVELILREMLSGPQLLALQEGDLDLGVIVGRFDARTFDSVLMQRDSFVAAIPKTHALAKSRGPLRMSRLRDEPLVAVPKASAPRLYEIVYGLAARADFVPRVTQEAIQMQTVLSLVATGLGIAIVPEGASRLARRGVIFRAISDPHSTLEMRLIWTIGNLSAAGRGFVDTAKKHQAH